MHLDKTRRSVVWMMVRSSMFLAAMLVTTGCLGPSPAERPEVELEKPQGKTRMATSVKREGGKVWIDGVPTLSWEKDGQCTYAGALAAALEVTEHPYSYSEIMGFSGLAFRVRWYQNDTGTAWCPSSPVGEFPEPIAATEQATGWRFRGVVLLGEKEPHMEQFAPDIVVAIDSGRPVLAYEPRLNMAVIYGYEGGGETVLLRDYFTGETPLELPTAKLGAMLLFLTEHGDPLPRREALVTALESAVRNWHRGRAANDDGSWYCYGEDALTAWKKDLGTVTILSDEQKGKLCFVSWWNFVSLHDARRNAVSFLRESAPLLDGDAARALLRAAELYHEEAQLLASALANRDAFLNSVEDWTPEVQQREREILAQAREKEASAIAEIKKALAAEGVEVVITAAAPGSTAPDGATKTEANLATGTQGKVLEELQYGSRGTTLLGCLEACAKYLGIDITPGWLYGGTGHAFVMCLTEDLCPSGPHCWNQGPLHRLSRNLPLRIEGVAGPKATPELLERAWGHVRESIDQGYPCYGWHWEWVLVKGYDQDGYLYSTIRDLEVPKDWSHFGAKAIGFLELYSVRPAEASSDAKTVRDALKFAVDWADSSDRWALEGYQGGPEAYDTWIRGLSEGKVSGIGLAYHADIWAECRRFAVEFLKEANTRTDGEYDALFRPAIENYEVVAASLAEVSQLFPMPDGPTSDEDEEQMTVRAREKALSEKMIPHLERARDAEVAGVDALRKIVQALDADLAREQERAQAAAGPHPQGILFSEDFESGTLPVRLGGSGWSSVTIVEGGAGGSKYAAQGTVREEGFNPEYWGLALTVDDRLTLSLDIYFDKQPTAVNVRTFAEEAYENFGFGLQDLEPGRWHHVESKVATWRAYTGDPIGDDVMQNVNIWVQGTEGDTFRIDNVKIYR